MRVELTDRGSLRLPRETAEACFGADDAVLVDHHHGTLRVTRLAPSAVGGLMLKHLNTRGDRAVLVIEQLPPDWEPGEREASWDEEHRALHIPVTGIGAGADTGEERAW